MSISTLPSSLASFGLASQNFSQVNFSSTQSCASVGLGLQIYNNDFNFLIGPNLGNFNETLLPYIDNGPEGYEDWWDGGPSPEWLSFWRSTLPSSLPHAPKDIPDAAIAVWANSTNFFEFFDSFGQLEDPSSTSDLAQDLALLGGCSFLQLEQEDRTLGRDYGLYGMVEDCLLSYCCPLDVESLTNSNDTKLVPLGNNWTIAETCAFKTCAQKNNGNPDLGGIGIIVSYYLEAALLAATWGLVAFTWVPRQLAETLSKKPRFAVTSNILRRFSQRNSDAVMEASQLFLDAAVYFALSIDIASIIFNYGNEALLYDDKLGQVSTLLAVNAPVSILLLTYEHIARTTLRTALVVLVCLMTFAFQFSFRRASTFNPSSSLCLNWEIDFEKRFDTVFIVKAVWGGLVFFFFTYEVYQYRFGSRHSQGRKASHRLPHLETFRRPWRQRPLSRTQHSGRWPVGPKKAWRNVRDLSVWRRIRDSKFLVLIRTWSKKVAIPFIYVYENVRWPRFFALTLAAYGVFAIFYDIQFIEKLRSAERSISTNDEDNTWGYGQLVALFLWLPVICEYPYSMIWPTGEREKRRLDREHSRRHMPTDYELAKKTDIDAEDLGDRAEILGVQPR